MGAFIAGRTGDAKAVAKLAPIALIARSAASAARLEQPALSKAKGRGRSSDVLSPVAAGDGLADAAVRLPRRSRRPLRGLLTMRKPLSLR